MFGPDLESIPWRAARTSEASALRRGATSRNPDGRKQASVLFADISGSTALSTSVELDEWWSVLAGAIKLMCETVHRFGGWVANFTGDGVQAVFESTERHGEHARRACEAALWLRDSFCEAPAQLERQPRLQLHVRIGINSGEVVTGTIGGGYSRHYTACGYTVAIAKRIEALARPGGICLSEHSALLIGAQLELSDLGAFDVKGARSPVGVFELLGPKVAGAESAARSAHRWKPWRGRYATGPVASTQPAGS